jgi:lipoprotein-anchoring transpeptidase ErfK/SrfK
MKKISLTIFMVILFNAIIPFDVKADNAAPAAVESYTGEALCLPDAYVQTPSNCLPYGPSSQLTEWAKVGLSMPLQPLPTVPLDPGLDNMPYKYAALLGDPTNPQKTYASPEDAASDSNPVNTIPASQIRYVAYTDQVDINGGHYVEIAESHEWIRASPGDYSHFAGLAFSRTPDNSFGWLVDTSMSYTAAGLENPATGNSYLRNTLIQIFDIKQANGEDWYEIGFDEWLESRSVRKVDINTTPPAGVTNNRWIEVNLKQQTLMVYDNRQLVYATMIATGMEPFYTRPGVFQIQTKKETDRMTGSFEADKSDYYYLDAVPWTMYFDGSRALHAAYWRAMFGYPQSHGCVNLAPIDAHWLYDWANVGDWVYVWDPSGATPTDPKFYGAGGA